MFTDSTAMSLRYRRDLLLSHDRNLAIPQRLKRKLFYFGILRKPSRTRPVHAPIPVRIRSRRKLAETPAHTPRQRNLTALPRAARHTHSRHRCLSFGLLNVRSLHRKVDDVMEIQRTLALDILLLTETWHDSDSVCLGRLRKEGFAVADQPRPRSREDSVATNHGGVALIARSSVRVMPISEHIVSKTFEFVCARLSSSSSSSVIVILLYRTGTVTNLFFDELSVVLNEVAAEPCPVLITGDLNVHIEKPNDPHTLTLLDLFSSYGFTCRVDVPTHDHGGILDVVFSRTDSPLTALNISDPGVSDHCLITWSLSQDCPPPAYVSSFCRPWNRLDPDRLQLELAESALCRPSACQISDADELADLYNECINTILDRLIPPRKVTIRPRLSDPWYDASCRKAKRVTRGFERRLRRLQCSSLTSSAHTAAITEARREWKLSVLSYRSLLRHKREAFWCSKIHALRHSSRELWLNFDKLMGRGRPPPSNLLTASELHQHFDRKIADVRAVTAGAPPPTLTPAMTSAGFSFEKVTVASVTSAIRRLPSKSSTSDPLHTSFLKKCALTLAPFITRLFNVSLCSGAFPKSWKQALVTPILKKGCRDVCDPKSYRPISNLTVLSKLLEKMASSQIRKFLNSNDLVVPTQSAYRENHSTETAALKLSSDLLLSIDKGNLCLMCFLDLSSAFDTIDHAILKERLRSSFRFSDSALMWTDSFLSDRTQLVKHGCTSSQPKPVTHGVPQGSVLGPLFFILYTSELTHVVQQFGFHLHMYADDIQIYGFCQPSKKSELTHKLEMCLDSLSRWFLSNRLHVNFSKTEFMWCASMQRLRSIAQDPIRFGSQLSDPAPQVKCLGVIFDSKLSFAPHVSKTVASCFAVLRQIRSVRSSLTTPLLVTLVQSLVLSRLDYCLSMLSGIPASLLRQLQSVLHASARIIFRASRFSSITPLLRELRWLPIQGRIALRLSLITHRCLSDRAPAYLSSELQLVSEVSHRSRLRSSATRNLVVPRTRCLTFGERSFPVSAARAWNSLPNALQAVPNHKLFKCLAKEHFLKIYYS